MATIDSSPSRPILPLHSRRMNRRGFLGTAARGTLAIGSATIVGAAVVAPEKTLQAIDYIANALDPDAESKRPMGKYIKVDPSGHAILDASGHPQITDEPRIVDVESYEPETINNMRGNPSIAIYSHPTDSPEFTAVDSRKITAHSGTIVFGNSYNSLDYGNETVAFNGELKVGGLWFAPKDRFGNPVDTKTGQVTTKPQYIKMSNVRIREKLPNNS